MSARLWLAALILLACGKAAAPPHPATQRPPQRDAALEEDEERDRGDGGPLQVGN